MLKRLFGSLRSAGQAGTDAPAAAAPSEAMMRAAEALAAAGRIDEAAALAEDASRAFPGESAAAALAARLHLAAGRSEAAVDWALAALRRAAPEPGVYVLLARALAASGRLEDAVLAMRQGEGHNADDAGFWNEFGLLHLKLGNVELARPRFSRAAALNPLLAAPWINLAIAEQARGRPAAAVPYLKRATELDASDGGAWSNYGLALRDSDRLPEAVEALRRAAALRPEHAQTRVNLAMALLDGGELEAAGQALDEAQRLAPDSIAVLVGQAQQALARGDASLAAQRYADALRLDPAAPVARAGLGELQLSQREFSVGWDNYEYRLSEGDARRFPYPRWKGAEPLDGALLVHAEQGIGDMILFASCFRELRDLPSVVLEAPERLVGLFRRSFPGMHVVPYAGLELPQWLDRIPSIAATIAAGSLMRLHRRSADAFPRHEGYLVPDARRVQRWRERLDALGPGRTIGVSWQGGFTRTGRVARSLELEELLPVLALPGVHAVSLQYTPGAEQQIRDFSERFGIDVVHWRDAIDDYEETAALVAALDGVVTVCTAVAHLAGALGRPVTVLAPTVPSWRYLAAGDDLPWYPSARVLRRRPGEPWKALVERVAAEIGASVASPVTPNIERKASTAVPNAPVPASVPSTTTSGEALTRDAPIARAAALLRRGDAPAAVAVLEAALAEQPDWAEGYAALARAYTAAGNREGAADCIALALHHDPDHADALRLACEVNSALGRTDAAIAPLEHLVALGQGGVEARCSLARLYYTARRLKDAESLAAAIVAEHPDVPEALDALGLARIGLEDYAGAIDPLERYVRIRPQSTTAQLNLAVAYLHCGRMGDSRRLCDWVLAREPNNYEASWHRAFIDLAHQRFRTGWADYERRRHLPDQPQITANFPRWDGRPIPGKTLLVLGEQGLGDEIMFASCFREALDRCGCVIARADKRLIPLFERSFPGLRVLDERTICGADVAGADFEILAGSLPVLFRPDADSFPRHEGYLKADPGKVRRWRERLAAYGPGPKFGLSWRGGVALTRARLRSVALDDLIELLRMPGAQFVSLQYGDVEADLARLSHAHGIDIPHFPEVIPDYDETAALVCALDGVVSVCTSLVHLTGALGRPGFVLVPSVAEWRYGAAGETMLWYPSVRLFRQAPSEPWGPVIARVAAALRSSGDAARHFSTPSDASCGEVPPDPDSHSLDSGPSRAPDR